jgi:hypothetical protein
VLVVPGVLVRRSDMCSLGRRRGDLASVSQQFEEEGPNPVWALAQLRRFGLGLMTVSHPNFVGLIRIPRPSTHRTNGTGEWLLTHSPSALPMFPDRREGQPPRRSGIASGRVQNPRHVPAVMERIMSIGGHDICELHGPAF